MCDQLRLFRTYVLANIPAQYMNLDWSLFPDAAVHEEVDGYVAVLDELVAQGIGFEFYGRQLGVGKTWAGTHLLKEAVNAGFTGFFVSFADIRNLMHEDAADRIGRTRALLESDFLMIDEIISPVSEAQRAFFEEKLEWVVRQRAACNMPTITTTNLTPSLMDEHYPRVYSVLSGHQQRVELHGADFRKSGKGFDDRVQLAMAGERRPLT